MCSGRIFLLLIFCFTYTAVSAEPDWVLKKDKDGIKVYTAKVGNSGFRSVRAECVITGTLTHIAAMLADVDRHSDWVYSIKSAKILKKVTPAEFIYYSEVSAPWPCSNRDFIVNFKMAQPAPGVLTIDSHAEPGMYPVQPDKVRVPYSMSHWTITLLAGNLFRVEYSMQFDPGGSVPAWVVNMFVTDGPYKTFKKLQERSAMPEYGHVHYDFIKD